MEDNPIDEPADAPYDPLMEARVSRLEEDMREVKGTLATMASSLVRIEAMLTSTLPHLATKAEMSELRSELKLEITAVRTELKEEITAVRTELKLEITAVRTELKEEIAAVRTELKEEIAAVRTELTEEIAAVGTDLTEQIGGVRSELDGKIGSVSAEARAEAAAIRIILAGLPTKAYMWSVLGVLLTATAAAYAGGLAAITLLR